MIYYKYVIVLEGETEYMIDPMSMYENVGFWMQYCWQVFGYLNGKINYMLPASNIRFGDPHRYQNNFVFGYTKIDVIYVNLLDIIHYCVKMKITDEEDIRCLIIFTVLHELSHCDQDIDYKTIKYDRREVRRVEVSNDKNTMAYLLQYYDDIAMNLGSFRLNVLETILYRTGGMKESDLLYTRINHQCEKVIRVLEYLTDGPLKLAFEQGEFYNCGVELTDVNGNHMAQIVMRNGLWMPFYNSFKILRKVMMRNNKFEIGTQITPQNQGLFIRVEQKTQEKEKPLYIKERRIQS